MLEGTIQATFVEQNASNEKRGHVIMEAIKRTRVACYILQIASK